MSFASPLLLLALVPVAALAGAYIVMQRRRQRYAARFATLPMLAKIVPARPAWRRHLPASLLALCLVFLGLAAARPSADVRVPYERATVIVAIDTSGSMLADDVEPDRLTAAKQAASAFVGSLPDTFNVGVVQFAGTASVIAPASTDHAQVRQAIEAMGSNGGGTAIGESVFSALGEVERVAGQAADGAGSGSGDSTGQGSAGGGSASGGSSADGGAGTGGGADGSVPARLVVLSDGANTAGRSPSDAAAAAREADTPVSTIAYGTADGYYGSLPVPVDESTLRQLASDTDGHFYRAESSQELRDVYDDIGSSIGWHTEPVDLTPWLALAGLLVACGAGALSLRWFSRLV